MKCPVDHSKLQVSHADDRIGWKCSSCDGIWLPASFVYSFDQAQPGFVEGFYEQLEHASAEDCGLSCPEGHGVLTRTGFGQTQLDWCWTCRGVWFDRNELDTVSPGHESATKPQAWPANVAEVITFFPWV